MTTILDAIDASMTVDKPVYVHCWGGVGWTGTSQNVVLLQCHQHLETDPPTLEVDGETN